MEDIETIFKNEYDKHILTEEQFNEMKSIEHRSAAILYIRTYTDLSLKEASCYYDFYHNENYND